MAFLWHDPPAVIGHRGSPSEAPENTLPSFEAALRAGARAIELDARLTRDGHVVVAHDAALGRTVAGTGYVEEMTLAQLRRHDAGAWFSPRFAGTVVPTLDEVLRALPDHVLLDVELKADATNAHALPGKVLDLVTTHRAIDRALVTSFDPELSDAYARLSGRSAGVVLPFVPERDDLDAWPRLEFIALAEDAVMEEALALARDLDRRLLVWTVNDADSARHLLEKGVASVITDRPAALLARLRPGASAR